MSWAKSGSVLRRKSHRKDVVDLVMTVVQRGANVLAGVILRELYAAYEFALRLGKLDENFVNPALLAKASLTRAKMKLTSTPGKRVLTDSELAQFLQWLPTSSYPSNIKNVLQLTLLTGCRTGEVCVLAWDNVDLQRGTIHLRETKTGIERHVQLSRQAITFLESLRASSPVHHLFASRGRNKPITQPFLNEASNRLRKLGLMIDIEPWTPHDLRRTVRTGLARLRCPNEVAETVLGHSLKGIEGTYGLHHYEAECKEWLQKWADYLDTLKK